MKEINKCWIISITIAFPKYILINDFIYVYNIASNLSTFKVLNSKDIILFISKCCSPERKLEIWNHLKILSEYTIIWQIINVWLLQWLWLEFFMNLVKLLTYQLSTSSDIFFLKFIKDVGSLLIFKKMCQYIDVMWPLWRVTIDGYQSLCVSIHNRN